MTDSSALTLSVTGLFAERDARRRHDQEAAEQLQRRKEEELTAFRQRLENFQLTDEVIKSGLDRIRRAFERGESELMFSSEQPDCLLTMPAGVRKVHEYWIQNLKPGDIGRFFTWPKSALEA